MRLPDSQPTGHEMLPTQSNTEEPTNVHPPVNGQNGYKHCDRRKHSCKFVGCEKVRVRQGYCTRHLREAGGGEVLEEIYKKSNKKLCKAESCSKHVSLRGYCLCHAHEFVDESEVRDYLNKKRSVKNSDNR